MSQTQPLILAQATAVQMPLRDGSVHCVATSCPYYGLRVYQGVEPSLWPGGSYAPVPGASPIVIPGPTWGEMAACEHVWAMEDVPTEIGRGNWAQGTNGRGELQPGGVAAKREPIRAVTPRGTCLRCAAWKGTLGNEETVARFVWHCLLWLREVKRVLRDDGCAWIILGDSFSASGKSGGPGQGDRWKLYGPDHVGPRGGKWHTTPGYDQGSLLGIPGLVHQAALGDGWIVRDDVPWVKQSPMPESVTGWRHEQQRCRCALPHHDTPVAERAGSQGGWHGRNGSNVSAQQWRNAPDPACAHCHGTGRLATWGLRQGSWRHTRATETVLMLTKQMGYFADSEAVREQGEYRDYGPDKIYRQRNVGGRSDGFTSTAGGYGLGANGTRNPRGYYVEPPSPAADLAALQQWLTQHCPEVLEAYHEDAQNPAGVLRPKPQSFAGAHFAVMPTGLIKRLILATCPERVCVQCGQGWAPSITAEPYAPPVVPVGVRNVDMSRHDKVRKLDGKSAAWKAHSLSQTVHGLRPSCAHYCTCPDPATCACGKLPLTAYSAGVVCDPFLGSGTSLEVARALGRKGVGLDMSYHYLSTIARERLGLTALARWEQGDVARPESFTDLPLFATS